MQKKVHVKELKWLHCRLHCLLVLMKHAEPVHIRRWIQARASTGAACGVWGKNERKRKEKTERKCGAHDETREPHQSEKLRSQNGAMMSMRSHGAFGCHGRNSYQPQRLTYVAAF